MLRNGEHIDTLPVAGLDRKSLIEMMLGRSFVEMYPETQRAGGDAALTVDNLTVPGRVTTFAMSVPKGKIVCIAGQVGSGAAEVVNALAGLAHDASGDVRVNGAPFRLGSASRALKHNVMFISGDRAEEGVFRRLSMLDNLVATRLSAYARAVFFAVVRFVQSRSSSRLRSASTGAACARSPTSSPAATSRSWPSVAASTAVRRASW